MKKIKLEVIRISEDVIATSIIWSQCFKAKSSYELDNQPIIPIPISTNGTGRGQIVSGTSYYNYLDGVGSSDSSGEIFTVGNYYCFDENSQSFSSLGGRVALISYYNWKTCTDPNHNHQ